MHLLLLLVGGALALFKFFLKALSLFLLLPFELLNCFFLAIGFFDEVAEAFRMLLLQDAFSLQLRLLLLLSEDHLFFFAAKLVN